MAEKDVVPMLSDIELQIYDDGGDDRAESQSQQPFPSKTNRTRSASCSIPFNSIESSSHLVGYTGPLRGPSPSVQVPINVPFKRGNIVFSGHKTVDLPSVEHSFNGLDRTLTQTLNDDGNYFRGGKNEHLLKSGQLGICNDPYCTTCPTNITSKQAHHSNFKSTGLFDPKFHNVLYGDAKGWAQRLFSFLRPYVPGVMNPHAKVLQHWNKFFVISCLVAIFVDPLFFFLLSVQKDNKCIVLDLPMTKTMVFFRSLNDFIYLLHMLLQFRLAYVAPESRVVGAGDLVDHPRKIARHYLFGYFLIDLFVVLPLPQVMVLIVLPKNLGSSGANYAKNLLRTVVLIQYGPRLYRFLPFIAGQSPSGFIFESAWANFVINLLTFVLAGHVVGSCWYLFGLQRVNQCLRDACHNSGMNRKFIDCGHGDNTRNFDRDPTWIQWRNNVNATSCFTQDGFAYGIYVQAVNLTTEKSIATRYIYALFWGFQQISTLAGNQIPSYFVWEVLFTMAIVGLGLLLFALLIGNMQNFLQSLGRRRLEMSLRGRDVEQWMRHRRLPEDLRRQVRESERYNWAATRGVNEEMLLENLPEDLQREIRRHLFKFVKKVRIFGLMDEPILDAICERLRQKTFIKGSKVLHRGGLIQKMVFIVRGKMESIGQDEIVMPLSEGDVCGEELLTWCLENSSINKDVKKVRIAGQPLVCSRTVKCLTNIEVFTLRASDIEEVTNLFARYLRNPRVQGAIRYESPYCRGLAASCIQVAWRYRKKRQNRADTNSAKSNHSSRQ